MSAFFKPYEGTRPYLFISYAHRSSEETVGTVKLLHEKGYRIWYDEGIPAGSDWPANIAQHLNECERVIFFLSERALQSHNCYSEIATAYRLRKPILTVLLEDVRLDQKWTELIGNTKTIPLLDTQKERADAILRSGFITKRFKRTFSERIPKGTGTLIASLLFLLASAGLLYLQMNGLIKAPEKPVKETVVTATPAVTEEPTPAPTLQIGEAEKYFALSFPDRLQEKAIRKALDQPEGEIYRWQLQQIRALYFCGSMYLDSAKDIVFYSDGTLRVNGAKVGSGQIKDLSLLKNTVNLETLALISQPVTDLSPLSGLTLLKELYLSGSEITGVAALKDLPSLETLHLEYTNVKDLTPLSALPNLKTVTVSLDMLPLSWSEDASFAVVLARETKAVTEETE